MSKKNNLSKVLLTIMSVVMISIGWYSEVLFYFYRLNGDGLDFIPSIAIGIGLTLLLSFFFIDINWQKVIGIIVLLSTSIFFTVAGQNYFYAEKHNVSDKKTATEENKQKLYDEYTEEIKELKNNIKIKESIIPVDLEEFANWKTNAVNPLRDDIATLKAEKVYYETKRESILLVNSDSIKIESLTAYEGLAKDLGLVSFTPLKIVSLALLSLFIALMAPCGMILIRSVWGVARVKPALNNNKPSKELQKITLFANSRYNNQENPEVLKSREAVTKETGLTQNYFNNINKPIILTTIF